MQSVVDSEFWRFYLQKNYEEFAGLTPHQQVISNAENVFSPKQIFDLEINLNEGACYDSENQKYSMPEYIACRNDEKIQDVETHLDIEYERWKGDKKAEMERMKFIRDFEHYQWTKKSGGDSTVVVTEFDIILNSIIERFDIKTQQWERFYEGKVRYLKYGRPVVKEFKLTPKETHSANEFSEAMWKLDFLEVKNFKTNEELRNFWYHLDMFWKPRIVREFNHFGFVEFENKTYFLAGNVLVKFPENRKEPLQLIAEKDGAFPVENNKFIAPPEDAVHLPFFEVGVKDPQSGLFKKKASMLLDEAAFERKLLEVEDHFCSMVGGDDEYRQWGRLIVAYVFSYFFFDEMYGRFNHVIYFYLYGQGNVGKGEVVKRILDFYGVNYLDVLSTPVARTVDQALEQKKALPVWVDEHVPEVPGEDAKIQDQIWNSWFELKPRTTNIRKGVSYGIERKEVRTMPIFCSNFKPKTDHLLSRSLILEYKKELRGPEKHVTWLKNQKELLQLLTLSFMQHYNLMDRQVFVWDLDRIRNMLKADVKKDLDKKEVDAILQDRQINQFATLLTVYHWLFAGYRREIQTLAAKNRNFEDEQNETHKELLGEEIQKELDGLLEVDLYNFVKAEIVRSAVIASRHDPLTDYLETIGTLIQAGKITIKHFSWTKEGHLKIWAKAVWDEYEAAKRGTESMVRRDVVEEKLKSVSDLGKDGDLKTVNWQNEGDHKPTRCKGFYIEDAVKKEILRINFNYEKFRPNGAPSYYSNEPEDETLNLDDELPF